VGIILAVFVKKKPVEDEVVEETIAPPTEPPVGAVEASRSEV